MNMHARWTFPALLAVLLAPCAGAQEPQAAPAPALEMRPCRVEDVEREVRCGTFTTWENRETRTGRRIGLNVVVVPARAARPEPDPVFFILGGPGQTATEVPHWFAESWITETRDVVLVDQRGTGGDNRLDCALPGTDADPQGYLDDWFRPDVFRACREELERRGLDLTQYGTAYAMDDLDDVRRALGYEKVNLVGGSYGTRAALTYMQRHPESVRTAILNSVAPAQMKNPLWHARTAQQALDSLFTDCRADARCGAAFPHLRREWAEVLERLEREPARVRVALPWTAGPVEVRLTAAGFGDAVRVMTYSWDGSRALPLLVHRAHQGDYEPFARTAVATSRGFRGQLRMGMLLSVVCGEDVVRITEEEIVRETAGTYLGDRRVRSQAAVCREWPRARVPANDAEWVTADVPVLLLSGSHDPVTGAPWARETARHLPNSLHLVVPGGHTPQDECTESIQRAFVDAGTLRGLDTSCVAALRPDPFLLPGDALPGPQS
ncbi:MAG TPA: alpha/beta hydrolase [Longimicrobium sp.]|nr:alpha/beta hydrolase [Longimicrobium sp.]